jgi:hypothetical protein
MIYALIVPPHFIVVKTVYIMTSFPLRNVPKPQLIGYQTKKKPISASFLNTASPTS